jgi:hypothetical protein
MVMLSGLDAVTPKVSATCNVKVELPAVEGVPEIVAAFSESPAGNAPAVTDHV